MPRKKTVLTALLAAIVVFAGATLALVFSGMHDQIAKADLGLVLGSKANEDGTPSNRLRARLDRAAELYQAGYFPRIIVSGGRQGVNEAEVMAHYLASRGVPKKQLIIDAGGVNTYTSALDTVQIMHSLKANSVLVVTQYFHIPRARLALGKAGVENVYSAHPDFFEARDLISSPRETVAYASYLFRNFHPAAAAGK